MNYELRTITVTWLRDIAVKTLVAVNNHQKDRCWRDLKWYCVIPSVSL